MATKLGIKFDRTNPEALAWARKRAAELVTKVSDATREALRKAIVRGFEEGLDVRAMSKEIFEAIGDADRADLIARTETLAAANAGLRELWGQAVEEGALAGTEKQVWIVTNDDKLCEICEPMDGVTVALGEDFDVDGESMSGPPAHPNCRCTVGISL